MANLKHPMLKNEYSQVTMVVLQTLGLSFAHAWNWAVLFSPFVFSSTDFRSEALINTNIIIYLLAMLLTVLLSNRLLTRLKPAIKARASTILALLSLAIIADSAILFQEQQFVLRVILWFIGGIGTSSLFFLWESKLSDESIQEKKTPYLHIAITSLIGGIFLFFIAFMQPEARIIILAVFIFLSVLFATFGAKEPNNGFGVDKDHTIIRPVDKPSNEVFSRRVFLFIMAYSLLLGYAAYYCHTSFLVDSVFAPYIGVTFIVAAIIMIALSYSNSIQGASINMIRFFMPISILLVSLMLMGPIAIQISSYLIIILFSVYTQMTFGTAVEKSVYAAVSEHAFLPSRFSGLLGVLLGWVLGFLSYRSFADQLISIFIIVMVLVLISIMGIRKNLWIAQKETSEASDRGNEQTVVYRSSRPGSYTAICQKISRDFGLTDRQIEILRLLGKGRNAHYIRSELFISEKTARTHIYNIYKKLNIHSQQDLLNLIDDYGKAQQIPENCDTTQVNEQQMELIEAVAQ